MQYSPKRSIYISLFKVLILLLISTKLLQCTKPDRIPIPNNRLESDTKIFVAANFLSDTSIFSSFLLNNGIRIADISDIDALRYRESALLLFRSGHVIKLSAKGMPKILVNSQGKGPGEFSLATKLKIRNNIMYIMDRELSKISKYTLGGNHINDIHLKFGLARSFEVMENGNIVILNMSPRLHNGSLMVVYNDRGEKMNSSGSNQFIQPILKSVNRIPAFLINKSQANKFVITSVLTGDSYIFNNSKSKITDQFTIQSGPEWEAMVEFENDVKKDMNSRGGYFRKIENVDFFKNGNIIISWGGPFKGDRTVSMIFDKNGNFLKRVYGNKSIKYRPTLLSVENDSILWVFSRSENILARVHIIPGV